MCPTIRCSEANGRREAWLGSFDVHAVRREFPVVQDLVYLNTGTAGVCPASVAETVWRTSRTFELEGDYGWGKVVEAAEVGKALDLSEEQVGRVYRDIDSKRRMAAYLHSQPLFSGKLDGELG